MSGMKVSRKRRKSRSQRYAEAIAEYVGARGARALTGKLNAVYQKRPSDLDPALKCVQLERLSRNAW